MMQLKIVTSSAEWAVIAIFILLSVASGAWLLARSRSVANDL